MLLRNLDLAKSPDIWWLSVGEREDSLEYCSPISKIPILHERAPCYLHWMLYIWHLTSNFSVFSFLIINSLLFSIFTGFLCVVSCVYSFLMFFSSVLSFPVSFFTLTLYLVFCWIRFTAFTLFGDNVWYTWLLHTLRHWLFGLWRLKCSRSGVGKLESPGRDGTGAVRVWVWREKTNVSARNESGREK